MQHQFRQYQLCFAPPLANQNLLCTHNLLLSSLKMEFLLVVIDTYHLVSGGNDLLFLY
jgi:hypothetical protein